MSSETYLTRVQAAEAIGRSVATVDLLISRAVIRPRRHGRRVLIPRTEIDKFFARNITVIWVKQNGKTSRRLNVPPFPLEVGHAATSV